MPITPEELEAAKRAAEKKRDSFPRSMPANLKEAGARTAFLNALPGNSYAEKKAAWEQVRNILSGPGQPQASPSQRSGQQTGDSNQDYQEKFDQSPFRFVGLSDEVLLGEERPIDIPVKGGVSGEIAVEWECETPFLIGRNEKDVSVPLEVGGTYVIPGSSLRGMLRASLEIVTCGRLSQVNDHHHYAVRDFQHPAFRQLDGNREVSVLSRESTKAGWLRRKSKSTNQDSGYEIVPCREWKTIAIADIHKPSQGYEYAARSAWLKKSILKRYETLGYTFKKKPADSAKAPRENSQQCVDFANAPTQKFRALTSSQGTPPVADVTKDKSGPIEGVIVCTNNLGDGIGPDADKIQKQEEGGKPGQPKKREYVFVGFDEAKAKPISQKDWDRFILNNSRQGSNRRVATGSWKDLEGSLDLDKGRIPVFYIEREGRCEFGLARFFKIAHTYSVGDILKRHANHALKRLKATESYPADFVETLFGYVREPEDIFEAPDPGRATAPSDVAQKGRVAVGFAYCDSTGAEVSGEKKAVMATPRASFAPFYLRGAKKDYSDPKSKLAGRKIYFPRFPQPGTPTDFPTGSGDTVSAFKYLEAKPGGTLRFKGRIGVHNVSPAELGALLWVITHGADPKKPYRHMLGRGKPFGMGQVRVAQLCLTVSAHDEAGTALLKAASHQQEWEKPNAAQNREGWLNPKSQSMEPFLRAFAAHLKAKTLPLTSPWVSEYLTLCDPAHGHTLEAAYPQLKEFQSLRNSSKLWADDRKAPRNSGPEKYLEFGRSPAVQATLKHIAETYGT